ncbi:MAG: hypothetical protein KDA24_14275 [Deltaproteobacteria bacterium]|nr:hypothetical protein [Deltaproteobacteria bacterium]
MRIPRETWLFAALLLAGCEINPDRVLTAESVELGFGEESFEPITDGDVLSLAFGSQGGQHVWGAFRLGDAEVKGPPGGYAAVTVTMTLDHPEGPVAEVGPLSAAVPGGTWTVVGQTVVVADSPWSAPHLYPEGWAERLESGEQITEEHYNAATDYRRELLAGGLTYRLVVVDGAGTTLTDERTVGLSFD